MELIGWVDIVGQSKDGVFEGQQRSWIDVEFDVQIDRSTTSVFGVQIDFPRLAQRVRLDEVSFVVHMEPMRHSVVFQISDESSDIYSGHYHSG